MTRLRRPARRVIVVLGLTVCTVLLMIPQTLADHGGNREVTDDSNDNSFRATSRMNLRSRSTQ
jgi:hypothetical protein